MRQDKATVRAIDFSRLFTQLCHMVVLRKGGRTSEAVDNLATTAIFLKPDELTITSASQLRESIQDYFGLALTDADVQSSINRLLDRSHFTLNPHSGAITLDKATSKHLKERTENAAALEVAVRSEWFGQLNETQAQSVPPSKLRPEQLWSCLQLYMVKSFQRHGVESARLLSTSGIEEFREDQSLASYLDQAIRESGLETHAQTSKRLVSGFFRNPSAQRSRYVANLLDATFTVFSLAVDKETANYLRGGLEPLKLFLDTNFIFSVLELHDNHLSNISAELIDIIQDNDFPFTIYYHKETLNEIERTVDAIASRLRSKHWPPALSRAALSIPAISGIERRFHELNQNGGADLEVFLSKYEHIIEVLRDRGFEIYRPRAPSSAEDSARHEMVAEYHDFIIQRRPGRPKPYEALNHDSAVYLTVRSLKKRADSALHAGSLFVTCDYHLYSFEWSRLLRRGEMGSIVLPNQLLQLIRPFVPTTDDFNRSFVESFSLPELRAASLDYSSTHSKVLSYLSGYNNVAESTAIRILTNEMLIEGLRKVDENSVTFGELIDSALAADNAQLLEERAQTELELTRAKKEAELQAERLSKAELAAIEANRLLQQEAEQRRLAEEMAAKAHEAELQIINREAQEKVRLADARSESINQKLTILKGCIIITSGVLAVLFLPGFFDWIWFLTHPKRIGLSLAAILIIIGAGLPFLTKKKYSLGSIVAGAIVALISVVDG